MNKKHLTAFALLLCLLTQLACPAPVRAADDGGMTASDVCLDLIRRYEGFSPEMYYKDGYWYVGYGSQVAAGAYPDGVTEEEAEALVREKLSDVEKALNRFCSSGGIELTQGQFDALSDFSYIHGAAWLNGSSALLKLVRGAELSRLETARAFGVWSHSGGKVLPGLADRHMEEAALYLDGSVERAEEFAYLSIEKRPGVVYTTDFAVYERGGVYDAFPTMFLLGYTLTGAQTADGKVLHVGDTVARSYTTTPVWEKNVYTKRTYDDVKSKNWFYDYVMELSEADVISGRGDGLFDPASPVTVGEALKLILLAAGKEEQPATESYWASGYVAFAHENGYLPAALLDEPEQPITRLDVAHLAAKAIGFGQSFSESPFADADDGYLTALAEQGVLEGMDKDGATVFLPDKSLTRAEVSTIVWRLRNLVALSVKQSVVYASHVLDVTPGVPFNSYRKSGFSGSGADMSYDEPGVTVLRGVDVSRFQGEIDWETAVENGVEFAILRVGGRYQQSGEIYDDRRFEEYYEGASAAGLRLGVYFYSQAVNTAEAVEEADYVLRMIAGKRIDGPVVFDWESAGISGARTNGIPAPVITDCAIAYCERVKAAGYTPMVYLMRYDGYMRYELDRLLDYDWWYAGEYDGASPAFFYDFQMWQYTSSALLDGFEGKVDMDLWFLR